jgi:branched-chain amino acid transport system ATP-binding protein
MLAIARALMSRPKLLLLDEPSLGVAPLIIEKIFYALKQLKDTGLSMILVEQNAKLALEFAEKGIVLEQGEITLSGTSKELLNDPRLIEAYLAPPGAPSSS